MVPDEAACPDGLEYVWQRGEGVFKHAAEVDPHFEICRDAIAMSKNINTFLF